MGRSIFESSEDLPRCLPGFEHVIRRWDHKQNRVLVKVKPGELYVTESNEMMMTLLGSCISVCIRDKRVGVAGMNHFLLPEKGEHMAGDVSKAGTGASGISSAARYGNWSMEFLINEILKLGGKKEHFEVKIFGGGAVLDSMSSFNIGDENIHFVEDYLSREGLHCIGKDVGGALPRKILFFPETGVVKVKKLREEQHDHVKSEELKYVKTLRQDGGSSATNIELFD